MAEIRRNPFGENGNGWIVVNANRLARLWAGQVEQIEVEKLLAYEADCPLCLGNQRHSGVVNPFFEKSFVFTNDIPMFAPERSGSDHPQVEEKEKIFFEKHEERGVSEVLVYTPLHNKSITEMSVEEVEEIIHLLAQRYSHLGKLGYINHVAEFENRGKEIGNSLIHPHAQILAQEHIPPIVQSEIKAHKELSNSLGENALIAYLRAEIKKEERIIYVNKNFGVVVPFWATWPYEILVIPTTPISSIDQLSDSASTDLAQVLKLVPALYTKLFERPNGAPYIMSIHQRPTDESDYSDFQMHIHFSTNLTSQTRQKFKSGYGEYFGPQRDLTPEVAAESLRAITNTLRKV